MTLHGGSELMLEVRSSSLRATQLGAYQGLATYTGSVFGPEMQRQTVLAAGSQLSESDFWAGAAWQYASERSPALDQAMSAGLVAHARAFPSGELQSRAGTLRHTHRRILDVSLPVFENEVGRCMCSRRSVLIPLLPLSPEHMPMLYHSQHLHEPHVPCRCPRGTSNPLQAW